MMKKSLKLLAGAALALSLSGCGEWVEVYEKSDVSAVYWHEGNRYSVALRDGNQITMKRLPSFKVAIFIDAETPWYICEGETNVWTGKWPETNYCELHLSSIDDITGADWNHGKFGSGKTTRIN